MSMTKRLAALDELTGNAPPAGPPTRGCCSTPGASKALLDKLGRYAEAFAAFTGPNA